MFTGLIQQAGRLQGLTRSGGGWRLAIRSQPWPDPLVVGESMAVQGACLTLVEARADGFVADLLSDSDAGAAKGGLFDDSGTLGRLIGRATTPIEDVIASALAG